MFFTLLLCKVKAADLYQKVCTSLLTSWQPSRPLTSWAFWQERIEPAKFSITHTAESSMKNVIWKQTKQKMDYSLGEARRKTDLAVQKLSVDHIIPWVTCMCFKGHCYFSKFLIHIPLNQINSLKSNSQWLCMILFELHRKIF